MLERVLYNFNYREGRVISSIKSLRRNRKHKIIKDGRLYKEFDYIIKFYLGN